MSATQTITVPPTGTFHAENASTITLQPLHGRDNVEGQGLSEEPHENDEHVDDVWDSKEGWKAVAAGASIFFVYLGLVYSYGIVQLHLERQQLASVPTLSFVGSVAVSWYLNVIEVYLHSNRQLFLPLLELSLRA